MAQALGPTCAVCTRGLQIAAQRAGLHSCCCVCRQCFPARAQLRVSSSGLGPRPDSARSAWPPVVGGTSPRVSRSPARVYRAPQFSSVRLTTPARRYFSKQAALHKSLHDVQVPTQQQLRDAYERLRDAPVGPLSDLEAACRSAGINAVTVASALRAGGVNTAREVSALQVLLLLLAMRCSDSLGAVLRGAFEVFGQRDSDSGGEPKLEVPVLLQLLGFLGAHDPEVTPALREAVSCALDGHVTVTLKGLAGVPALASMLAGA